MSAPLSPPMAEMMTGAPRLERGPSAEALKLARMNGGATGELIERIAWVLDPEAFEIWEREYCRGGGTTWNQIPVVGRREAARKTAAAIVAGPLAQAIAAARVENPWQDISTAPRDRTRILVAVSSLRIGQPMIVGEAYFDPDHEGGTWWWSGTGPKDYFTSPIHEMNAGPPTHWMPLPPPPTTPHPDTASPVGGGRA